MFNLIVVFCLVAVASAATLPRKVEPVDLCEANGQFLELRVTAEDYSCGTPPCVVTVGEEYDIAVDFIPSEASEELSMKFSLLLPGVELVIVETPVRGSAVSPGISYTLRYPLTADGMLAGVTFDMKMEVKDSETNATVVCVKAPVSIVA